MKTMVIAGRPKKVYQPKDLDSPGMAIVIESAKNMWKQRIKDYSALHGDVGSCVLGAGIAVHFLDKRQRVPRSRIIINPHDICTYQGSCTWEDSADDIVSYLNHHGIDCWFEYGRLD